MNCPICFLSEMNAAGGSKGKKVKRTGGFAYWGCSFCEKGGEREGRAAQGLKREESGRGRRRCEGGSRMESGMRLVKGRSGGR